LCKFICRFFKKKQPIAPPPPPPPPVNPQEFYYYYATQHLNCIQNSGIDACIIKVPANLNGFSWYSGFDGFQYIAGNSCPEDVNAVQVLSAANRCAELNQVLV
jgi:hypothetical protein